MMLTRTWARRGLVLFAVAVVLKTLVERRPDKLPIIILIGGIAVAAVGMGWLFAVRRSR